MKKQKPVRDLFWVEIEKEQEDSFEMNKKQFYLESSYNVLLHARQYGKVYQIPVHDNLDLDIKKGDIVYFHHFVTADEENAYGVQKGVNRVNFIKDKKVYKVHNSQIYGRIRKGKFKSSPLLPVPSPDAEGYIIMPNPRGEGTIKVKPMKKGGKAKSKYSKGGGVRTAKYKV